MPVTNLEPAPLAHQDLSPGRRDGALAAVVRLSVAVGGGAFVGAVTEWSVLHVPFALLPLSNSAAPWILFASVVALTARCVRESLVLAILTLLALIAGFYLAQTTRGWTLSAHQLAFWCATTVIVGPLIGVAVGWVRHATHARRAVGGGVLGGLLAGEAVHGLQQPAFLSPHEYWQAQLAIGVALTLVLTVSRLVGRWRDRVPILGLSTTAFALAAMVTFAAYQLA
jgi:hypothetical protein